MGMIYRKDIFEQYGITPPTTWAEYEQAAQTVKDAGGPLFGDFGCERARRLHGAAVPERRAAVHLRPGRTRARSASTSTTTPPSRFSTTGAGLSSKGLVGKQDQFTPEYIAGVIGGDYATYISAAWAPGYLQGAGVGEGADADVWATAPLPQWDPGNPVQVNWGGSAFSVTSQADDPELAAKVAFGVYADDESLRDGWENQIIFPLNVNVLNDPEFVDLEVEFFDGQQANKEVYVPAANAYKGMTYTPFGQFYYDAFTEQLAAINDGSVTGSEAADGLQEEVVAYAEEQGFTVK